GHGAIDPGLFDQTDRAKSSKVQSGLSLKTVRFFQDDTFKTSEQIQDGARSDNVNNQRPNTTKSTSIKREIRRQIHLIQELSKPDNQQITAALIDSLRRK
ncbi:hypothetical protein, partial [Dyadobacter sp. OTU695]|uniref:hypothetical protein n=1 Tax=Dyadobacter sp. OTU695 TaxID=3043860 RepID=UPI00313AA8F3